MKGLIAISCFSCACLFVAYISLTDGYHVAQPEPATAIEAIHELWPKRDRLEGDDLDRYSKAIVERCKELEYGIAAQKCLQFWYFERHSASDKRKRWDIRIE